jgi:hypothetical protein
VNPPSTDEDELSFDTGTTSPVEAGHQGAVEEREVRHVQEAPARGGRAQ